MTFIIGIILSVLIIFGLYKIYKLHKHRIEEEKEHLEVLSKLNGLVMSSHLRMMEKIDKSAREKLKELEEKEKERVSNLRCTKRVLALILKELGVSYANLQALIATSEDAQLEWDLCVELERSNPLLDILGAQLGLTPTTIDKIFKYANGEIGKEDFDETDMVKGGIANG